jgi:hypothetical protein
MAKKSTEQKNEERDLKEVMSSAGGRRFVWRVLTMAGLDNPCYSPEAEGGRRVALALKEEILTVDSSSYLQMFKEQISKEANTKREEDDEG